MSNKPIVSVAICFYNQEKFIKHTLQSVLKQKTTFSYEIVIGEDCSTDGSKVILEEYIKNYPDKIKVIYNPRNLGLILNVKNIIDHCQGKYISMLGGDDFFLSDQKLQKQYDFLENNPEYGFVHSDAQLLISTNDQKPQLIESAETHFRLHINSGDVYEDLLQKCYIAVCTTFFKKDLYTHQEDYEHWCRLGFQMEDYPLWLSLARVTKFGYIKEPLSTYRILSDSISRPREYSQELKFWLSSTKVTFYFLEKYGASEDVKRRVLRKNYLFYFEYALYFRDKEMAHEALGYFQKINDSRLVYLLYYWGAGSRVVYFLLKVLRKFIKSLEIMNYKL